MTVSEHFRRLELMNKKYSGGSFVIDENGERAHRIAQLPPAEQEELDRLDGLLAQAHRDALAESNPSSSE